MFMKNVKSYAKINLSLNLLDRRPDGYHNLDSIMVPIELHDSILISPLKEYRDDNFVTVDDFSNGLVHYNLVSHAVKSLTDRYGSTQRFRIYIHKNIPMQAGLGGGSSNAAFTVKAVNNMLKFNATDEELVKITTNHGADIPFFISCKPSRCRGIGEDVTPITIKNDYYVIIVKPADGCSTKEVFRICDEIGKHQQVDIDKVQKALEDGDDEALCECMGNSLEEAACTLVPEIRVIKGTLQEKGIKLVLMSGSGSAVFGLSTDKALIKRVAKSLEDVWQVEVSRILK